MQNGARMRVLTFAFVLAGCNARSIDTSTGGAAWSGQGLVVHEWGTHTLVVGSDGSLLRGLHHEEEDLPPFVYDRIKQGGTVGPVIDKMETPVLYFYSPSALAMKVSVDFPRGVMTQWFPLAQSYYPLIARTPQGFADPVMDPHFPFGSAQCQMDYGTVGNGLLDWGTVQVLGRSENPALPDAPLAQYGWAYARNVGANHVRVNAEAEKFLFYRGLGNLDPPAQARFDEGKIVLENGAAGLGHVMALSGTSFVEADSVAAGERWSAAPPSQAGDPGAAMVAALDGTGLYHDEAEAMVATWKRQWFGTPGLRLLYLAPAAWTDAALPLHLDPAPSSLVRVMVMRVELLTPDDEAADVTALMQLGDAGTAASGEAHFRALGRFAEPHLRRALALAGNPAYAQSFLDEIAGPAVSSAGE
jgi:hypothetical protein